MKEIFSLSVEYECFGEVDCESTTKEMKDGALVLLLLLFMKRSCEIEFGGVAKGIFQRTRTN